MSETATIETKPEQTGVATEAPKAPLTPDVVTNVRENLDKAYGKTPPGPERDEQGKFKAKQPASTPDVQTKAPEVKTDPADNADKPADTKPASLPKYEWSDKQKQAAKELGISDEKFARMDPVRDWPVLKEAHRAYSQRMAEKGKSGKPPVVETLEAQDPDATGSADGGDDELTADDFLNERAYQAYLRQQNEIAEIRAEHETERQEDEKAIKEFRKQEVDDLLSGDTFGHVKALEPGKPRTNLEAGSVAKLLSDKIADEVDNLAEYYADRGEDVSTEILTRQAMQRICPDDLSTALQEKEAAELAEHNRNAGSRPTSRKTLPPVQDIKERAISTIRKVRKAYQGT